MQQTRESKIGAPDPQVFMRFIELHHAEVLKANLPKEHASRSKVISGAFENEIIKLLTAAIQKYRDLNAFLYVDPYGIKALSMPLFLRLPEVFSSAELLINLNSFGFIREALRVRQVALRESEDELLSELDEYEPSVLQSVQDLDRIAGGEYWKDIVDRYAKEEINIDEAEKAFADLYKQTLRKSYSYVLDMPIRLHPGNKPKYRMVHATNHPDGCTLMADNMFKRTDYLVVMIQNRGQTTMWETTPENEVVDDSALDEKMLSLVEKECGKKPIRLNELQALFFDTYGVICSTKHLSSAKSGSVLKRLEQEGKIVVIRNPEQRNGTKTRFWTEKGKDTIQIMRK